MDDDIKEIKKKRVSNITQIFCKILNYITDNNIIKGNIVLSIHCLFILIYFLLIFFFPVNVTYIILLICLALVHISINQYFGRWSICILVKIERYFYDDLSWYGPFTKIFL